MIYQVKYDDLLFAEASRKYTKIVTIDKILLPMMPFSVLEQQIPTSQFTRIHRSFIVNKSKITRIDGNWLFIGDQAIPIGKNHLDELFKILGL